MRFMGEEMGCAICGRSQISDPRVESNWRYIELSGVGYYVCDRHFPDDSRSAPPAKVYRKAYAKVLKKLIKLRNS